MNASFVIIALLLGVVIGGVFVALSVRSATPTIPPRPLTPDEEATMRAIIAKGTKIEAIKAYRELTGAGLKDAKDAVEALQERG